MEKFVKPPEVPPEKVGSIISEAVLGIKKFSVLLSAYRLGFFEYLKKPLSIEEVSDKTNISPRLTELMLKALEKMELVERKGKKYKNTEISTAYLTKDSFYNMENTISWMEWKIKTWMSLEDRLRGLPMKGEETPDFTEIIRVMAEECVCGHLQETVRVVSSYREFHKAKKLLDLGGGHGMYAIAFSMINPELKCFVFDLPHVVKETEKYIKKYGAKNVHTIQGDFFRDEPGTDYDIVFSSFHPGGKNPEVARKIARALKRGGLYFNKQCFHPDNDPRDSLEEILEDMEWNFSTFRPGKGEKIYTFKGDLSLKEYKEHLRNLGFEILNVHSFNKMDRMLVARKSGE